jgi:hypothetical protein
VGGVRLLRCKCTLSRSQEQIQIPDHIFQHVHVDLVGPLPVSEDNQAYIMTIINHTSRWVEAVPLTSVTVEKCADAFVETWVSTVQVRSATCGDYR